MAYKAFNLRGTNGSGKTTVAREILKLSYAAPDPLTTHPKAKKPSSYKGVLYEVPIVILGSYETTCGGCDTINNVGEVARLLKVYRDLPEHGLIFYEGLMISHMIGTVGGAVAEWGDDHIMGFLDTPVDECIARVVIRRHERGNHAEFDPNKNLVKDHRSVQNCKRNAIQGGFKVVDIHYKNALNETLGHLASLARVRAAPQPFQEPV